MITHDRKGHSARTECTNQHTSADDASPSTPPRHTKCAGDTPDVLIETHEGIVHPLRAQERRHGGVHEHHAMRRVMHVQPGAHEVGSRAAYVTLHTGPRGEDSPACSRPTHVRRAEQPTPDVRSTLGRAPVPPNAAGLGSPRNSRSRPPALGTAMACRIPPAQEGGGRSEAGRERWLEDWRTNNRSP